MSSLRIMSYKDLNPSQLNELLDRKTWDAPDVQSVCRDIIDNVRGNGDTALLDYTRQFDGVDLSNCGLRVPWSDFENARERLSDRLKDAIDNSLINVRKLHETQIPKTLDMVEVDRGMWCGERWSAIDAVCLYVPRGRGAFASVAYMLGVPGTLAGVERLIICTPPGPEGEVDDATLYAAAEMGITEIYRVGGAQAVAAVAFGTDTIPRCDKILGPGNVYVTAARQLLAETLDPGPIAGPSESLIICDNSPNPVNAAWNLLIEAEHGENSCALLLTDSDAFAQKVAVEIEKCRNQLTDQRRRYADEVLSTRGGILVTSNIDETIDFANRFAAEHVAIMVREPWDVVSRIKNAGEILIGDYPIISLGNYAMGINAILPTGGWAKTSSGVSVLDFMKRTSIGYASRNAFEKMKQYVPAISKDEGFSAHHKAILNWQTDSDANTGEAPDND